MSTSSSSSFVSVDHIISSIVKLYNLSSTDPALHYIATNRNRFSCITIYDHPFQLSLLLQDLTLPVIPPQITKLVPPITSLHRDRTCIIRSAVCNEVWYVSPITSLVVLLELTLSLDLKQPEQSSVDAIGHWLQLIRLSGEKLFPHHFSSLQPRCLSGFFIPSPTSTSTSSLTLDTDEKMSYAVLQLILTRLSSTHLNMVNILQLTRLYLENDILFRQALIEGGRTASDLFLMESRMYEGTAKTTYTRLMAVCDLSWQLLSSTHGNTNDQDTAFWWHPCPIMSPEVCLSLLNVYGNHAVRTRITNTKMFFGEGAYVFFQGCMASELPLNLPSPSCEGHDFAFQRAYDVQWHNGSVGCITYCEQPLLEQIARSSILRLYSNTIEPVSSLAFALLSWFIPNPHAPLDTVIKQSDIETQTLVEDLRYYESDTKTSKECLNAYSAMVLREGRWRHSSSSMDVLYAMAQWCFVFDEFIVIVAHILRIKNDTGSVPLSPRIDAGRHSARVIETLAWLPLVKKAIEKATNNREDILRLVMAKYKELKPHEMWTLDEDEFECIKQRLDMLTTLRPIPVYRKHQTQEEYDPSDDTERHKSKYNWIKAIVRILVGGWSITDSTILDESMGRKMPFWVLLSNDCIQMGVTTEGGQLRWMRSTIRSVTYEKVHPLVYSVFDGTCISDNTRRDLTQLFKDCCRTQTSTTAAPVLTRSNTTPSTSNHKRKHTDSLDELTALDTYGSNYK